jgi:hypothetical protein
MLDTTTLLPDINTSMSPLKSILFSELKKAKPEFEGISDKEIDKQIFKMPSSMALTYSGFVILKKYFTAYSFPINENLKPKYVKNLSRLESPYFYITNRLIIFSSMDAMTIKLVGGVEQFLSNNV